MDHRVILCVMAALGCLALVGCPDEAPSPPPAPPSRVGARFTPQAITLREVPGSDFKELMDARLVFVDEAGVEWTAPKGTWTDGASVPRLALPVTDGRFDKKFLKAAVVHDAYCQKENETRCPDQYQQKPWKEVHRMFYEACLVGGTSQTVAGLMYAGVRWGGPRWGESEETVASYMLDPGAAETLAGESYRPGPEKGMGGTPRALMRTSGRPERNPQRVSDDALQKELEACQQWIEANNPSIEEIEQWMEAREQKLLGGVQ